MASTIYHMDSANLFIGDEDPTNSLYLVLKNIKLPGLEEIKKEHLGGGALGKVSMGMGAIEALVMTFNLDGFTPDVLSRFMSPLGRLNYTIRGNVRDFFEQKDIEVKAILQGRMTKVEMSEFDRDKGLDTSYEITENVHYELYFDGQEKIYFDLRTGRMRIDGVEVNRQRNINLGIGA